MTKVFAETLIFEDNFNKLDFGRWQHETTMSGGGNWEFEMYRNNRTNSFIRDGVLYLQPSLTAEAIGENAMKTGDMAIWGNDPSSYCTSNAFYGCERNAAFGNWINPIMSSRLRTVDSFSFTYGRMEVRAQLPQGDWIWPAIWLLPKHSEYGLWPASGEIDIMESRGNECDGWNSKFGSTLHWGPNWDQDMYEPTTAEYVHSEPLSDEMHTYGLIWTEQGIKTYIDDETNVVLDVDMSSESFWSKGGWTNQNNPWEGETPNAPFNRDFYLIFNVAVGGVNGYFPDDMCNK